MNNTLQPVPFHEDTVFIIDHEGEPYVPVKPICENMGLAWQTQHRKLTDDPKRFCVTMMVTQLPNDQQQREVVCIHLKKFAAWIYSISPDKVAPHLKETIEQYQDECDGVLFDYWFKGSAINPRTVSADIPPGMMLVSVLEHIGLYKRIDSLQEEQKDLLRQRIDIEENKTFKRIRFTQEEDELVMDLLDKNFSHRQIGERIGRPTSSIKTCIRRVQGLR